MKKILALFLCLLLALAGCSGPGTPREADAPAFVDDLGREVAVESPPKKVAALMGSFAEVWLLAGGELFAYTADALDERGIEVPADAVNLGMMKSPGVELMIEHGVDFAILSANVAEHVALRETLEDAGIPAAYFDVETFEDYLAMLERCTALTGRTDLYEENGLSVKAEIDAAVARKEGREPPTVLFIRSFSTGAKAKNSDNNMTGKMLADLGCVNIADREQSLLEDLSMEVIIEEDPDYIFVVTMGASDEKALATLAEGIQSNPAWAGLSAVKNGRYVVLPKELFHLKPNNRWGESYAYLADILYG